MQGSWWQWQRQHIFNRWFYIGEAGIPYVHGAHQPEFRNHMCSTSQAHAEQTRPTTGTMLRMDHWAQPHEIPFQSYDLAQPSPKHMPNSRTQERSRNTACGPLRSGLSGPENYLNVSSWCPKIDLPQEEPAKLNSWITGIRSVNTMLATGILSKKTSSHGSRWRWMEHVSGEPQCKTCWHHKRSKTTHQSWQMR